MTVTDYDVAYNRHKDAHIKYWAQKNTRIEINRYEDGFKKGWEDSGDHSCKDSNQRREQRKNEHIQHCGNSDLVWEFEHGYNEAFSERRCSKPAQPQQPQPGPSTSTSHHGVNYDEARRDQLCHTHKCAHEEYGRNNNRNVIIAYFEDGFRQGWNDQCEGCADDNKMHSRKGEYLKSRGHDDHAWEYADGYKEGCQARKSVQPSGHSVNYDETRRDQLCNTHKCAHLEYAKNNNRPARASYFEAGFRQGWNDQCEGSADDNKMHNHKGEYLKQHGHEEHAWEYADGYREGCQAKRTGN